jgi:hypothetical protein
VEHAAAMGQTTLYCEVDSDKAVVHISAIAPDLLLSDLEHIRMEYKDLQNLKKLGEGAFGVVYKAQYKNEDIAFKQLNVTGGSIVVVCFCLFVGSSSSSYSCCCCCCCCCFSCKCKTIFIFNLWQL